MKSRSKQPDLTFGTLLACTEILLPGQNPIQPWILTRAPVPRNTFQNDSFRSKRISFPSLPKHWCRLAHTRCRQVTTIGGGWGPAMSSIATILPGTPGPSCDSQALGGAQSQTKQIYDEVQRRDDHGHYMARWFSKLNITSYTMDLWIWCLKQNINNHFHWKLSSKCLNGNIIISVASSKEQVAKL